MRSRRAAPPEGRRHAHADLGRGRWARWGRLPIRTQLLLLVAAVALPFGGLLTYLNVDRAENDLATASAAGRSVAQAAANDVERLVADARMQLETLALRPLIRAVDPARCDPLLADLRPLDPAYANVGVIDPAGRVVCSGVPLSGGQPVSVAAGAGFQSAMASGTFTVGPPLLGPITHRWVAVLFVPLRAPDGSLHGLVFLPIDLLGLSRQLGTGQPAEDRTVTIVDGSGTVVARSVDGARWVGTAGHGLEIVDQVLAGHEGTVIAHGIDGVERAYGYAPIPVAGWYVYAGTPTSVALAPTRNGLLRVAALSLAILVLVVLLALWFTHSIARPIEDLAAATALGTAPQATSPVVAAGSAEVADMASSFNRVVESRVAAESDLAGALDRERAARAEADASRRLIEEVVERTTDGVVGLDPEWRYTYLNENAATLLGRPGQSRALVGRHIWTEFPEGIGQSFQLAYERAFREQVPIVLADYYEPMDQWFENRIYASAAGLTIFFTNITERKQAERALALQADMLASVNDAVLAFDDDLRVTYWNASAARIYGWSAEEAIGRTAAELLRSELTTEAQQAVVQELSAAGFWRGVVVHHRRDGTPIVIESATAVHHGVAGPPQYVSVNRDITERQAVDDELRRTAQRLAGLRQLDEAVLAARHPREIAELALAHLDRVTPYDYGGVYLIDVERSATVLASRSKDGLDLGVMDLSGARARLTEVALGAALIDLRGELGVAPQVAQMLAAGLRTMALAPLNVGDTLIGFLGVGWPDGAPIPADAVAHVGEVANVLAIALQTSALHEDVARHAAELEVRVSERTAQLQEVNDELEAFTYTVSHDLRAPLRAMQGMSGALLEDHGPELGAEGRDFAARIVAAGARMDGLIQDLLGYSRLSRTDVKLEPVDLDDALHTALEQLHVQLSAAAAEVTVAPHLGVVIGQRGILVQVLANLVGNAAKFVRPDVPPRISVSSDDPAPGRIRVLVTDEGIGIAAEYRERIFRVFERLHGQETYPGTGVGLAIVRKGVERMGGAVGVESDGSSWSRFWFELEAGGDERHS